jgi:transcriptional regulator with GAF, ATPase, and Fis domain
MKPIYFTDFTNIHKKVAEAIKQLHADIVGQIGAAFSPFVWVMDDLPNHPTLAEKLKAVASTGVSADEVVLVIINPPTVSPNIQWELLQTGIKDIYYWAGEDDFRDYLLFTIQRKQKVAAILNAPFVKDNLIGESKVWKDFLGKVLEAALYSQCSFLLTGESGTGKELVSRLIHTIDKRPDKQDLVLLDCTTIVPELSGSEFFGHERGSYTNAVSSREGAFALANKGTLFLDEIGDLPLTLQAGLLRVIQEGTYKKVGSNSWQKTHFRLVCATHRNLRQQVIEMKFRQDLFYRISDFEFTVPSLAQRKEDIPLLANYFMQQFSKGNDVAEFDSHVLDFLTQRDYPGNIRELRQLIQRIGLRHVRHKKVTIGEIPLEERTTLHSLPPPLETDSLNSIVRRMVQHGDNYNLIKEKAGLAAFEAAIELCGGNKQKAAERLGVDVRTVQLGIKRSK